MSPTPILSAYILAEDEASLAIDRKVLRSLGIVNMTFFSSGRKALEQLQSENSLAEAVGSSYSHAEAAVDILICAERLEDMTGLQFIRLVRASGPCSRLPALFLVGTEESRAAMAARASNSCAVLTRPYSPTQAKEALQAAARPEYRHAPMVLPPSFIERFSQRREETPREFTSRRATAVARSASSPARPTPGRVAPQSLAPPSETALQMGLNALQLGDMETAGKLLRQSHEADPSRVETCLALSKLNSSLEKEDEASAWLCRAAMLCFIRGEKSRGGNILSRLPRGKAGQTLMLAESAAALQIGEIKAAALAFLEMHRLDPDQQLHSLVGRACMFTPTPEKNIRELIRALGDLGHGATAGKLLWRLLEPPRQEEHVEHTFLMNFPLLYDVVSVACHTFRTWRLAAKE